MRRKGEGRVNLRGIFLDPTGEWERPGRTEHPLSYQLAAWLVSHFGFYDHVVSSFFPGRGSSQREMQVAANIY